MSLELRAKIPLLPSASPCWIAHSEAEIETARDVPDTPRTASGLLWIMTEDRRVRGWLLFAFGAVVVEQSLAQYPHPGSAQRVFWIAISAFLLYRVHRGGNTARCWFAGMALFGCIICTTQLPRDPHLIGLTLVCAAQVVAMMVPPIRAWTGASVPIPDADLVQS